MHGTNTSTIIIPLGFRNLTKRGNKTTYMAMKQAMKERNGIIEKWTGNWKSKSKRKVKMVSGKRSIKTTRETGLRVWTQAYDAVANNTRRAP